MRASHTSPLREIELRFKALLPEGPPQRNNNLQQPSRGFHDLWRHGITRATRYRSISYVFRRTASK
ncbi:hypothetical protein FOA52_012309 [Chlamydomonas sp. UWO 241]|nr:hypothetical protein FOA52_012309 [Chlamydomonas sp. UWO 241]